MCVCVGGDQTFCCAVFNDLFTHFTGMCKHTFDFIFCFLIWEIRIWVCSHPLHRNTQIRHPLLLFLQVIFVHVVFDFISYFIFDLVFCRSKKILFLIWYHVSFMSAYCYFRWINFTINLLVCFWFCFYVYSFLSCIVIYSEHFLNSVQGSKCGAFREDRIYY